MVKEEEFEAGDRDSRVIQQSNFTPSLHCHQQKLKTLFHMQTETSKDKLMLREILNNRTINA